MHPLHKHHAKMLVHCATSQKYKKVARQHGAPARTRTTPKKPHVLKAQERTSHPHNDPAGHSHPLSNVYSHTNRIFQFANLTKKHTVPRATIQMPALQNVRSDKECLCSKTANCTPVATHTALRTQQLNHTNKQKQEVPAPRPHKPFCSRDMTQCMLLHKSRPPCTQNQCHIVLAYPQIKA